MLNKIKYVVALIVFASSLSTFAGTTESVSLNSAHWYFNLRTNLNSAAIITGIAATWHALYYGVLPATKTGIEFALGNIDKQAASKNLKIAASKFTTSMFLAGLALAIEGVNKFYLRDKFYHKVALLNQ